MSFQTEELEEAIEHQRLSASNLASTTRSPPPIIFSKDTMATPAFALGAVNSAFTSKHVYSSTSTMVRPVLPVTPIRPAPISITPVAIYTEPQPGDPGSKPLPPVPKGFGMDKAAEPENDEAKTSAAGKKLPLSRFERAKRGLDLLKDDLFKNAPEQAGVGRQDVGAVMKPVAGEPGYKPAAYETVRVSELGISPFPDDANAVGKVGGVAAVKAAAVEVKKGEKTASQIKKQVMNIKTKDVETVFDIPSYLKPLPEDTPKITWKNYVGR